MLGVINMKNNFMALILHFAIVILSIIFLIIFVVAGPKLGKYTTHIISTSYFAGTLLDINTNKKFDFFTGSFTAVIGIALWVYTFSMTGENLS